MARKRRPIVKVEVCERSGDFRMVNGEMLHRFHASSRRVECVWGCGNTIETAIADMMSAAPSLFPNGRKVLKIRWMGRLPR